MANVVHADDPATFDETVLQSDVPVVVDFWAGWCSTRRIACATPTSPATL